MITKITKGRSFGGALDYLFYERAGPQPDRDQGLLRALDRPELPETDRDGPEREEDLERSNSPPGQDEAVEGKAERKLRGEVIAGNVAGRTIEEIQREMEAVASRRPEVERKVLHMAVSTRAEDNVTPETQAWIAERFAARMGFDKTVWIAVRHENDHGEFHTLAVAVDYKGRTISDSKDFERSEEIARELTREFNLTPDIPSKESMRRCLTQAEMKEATRSGRPSTRAVLQEIADDVIGRGVTATEFVERLEERGVQVVPYIDREDEVKGISYRLDGKLMRGSDLGRGYSWPGLQKEWDHHKQYREGRIDYERERDYPAISQAGEREEERIRAAATREHRDDERADRTTGRATDADTRAAGSHREKPDPPAAERGRVHEAGLPPHRGGDQEVRDGGAETTRAGKVGGRARSAHGGELAGDGRDHREAEAGLRGDQPTLPGQGDQRAARLPPTDSRRPGGAAGGREEVPGVADGVQGPGAAGQPDLRDGRRDGRGTGGVVQEAPERGRRGLGEGGRAGEGEVPQNVPQSQHGAVGSLDSPDRNVDSNNKSFTNLPRK